MSLNLAEIRLVDGVAKFITDAYVGNGKHVVWTVQQDIAEQEWGLIGVPRIKRLL